MPDIGPLELVIVLIIAILVVGPKKLPQLGRSLGSGMREFKDSITGKDKGDGDGDGDEDAERDAFGEPARRPAPSELDPSAAEPEVVTGETRREDQPASHRDS
jgi:sec-independent protein translocase protein TatA